MAEFDPDKYLSEKMPTAPFDPDQYLAQKSGGWTPDQQAEIAKIKASLAEQPKLGGILPVRASSPTQNVSIPEAIGAGGTSGGSWQLANTEPATAALLKRAKEQQPVAFHLANIASSIPSYVVTAPIRGLRAIQGAIEGFGSSAGESLPEQLMSSATGALSNVVIPEAVAQAAGPAKTWLLDRAGGLVGRALARGGGKIAEAAKQSGALSDIGKEVLERGAAGFTPAGTAEAIKPAQKAIGQAIGDALETVDAQKVPFSGAKAAQRIEDEVRAGLLGEESSKGMLGHVDDLISDLRSKFGETDFTSANDFKSRMMKTISDAKWALKEGTPAQKMMKRSLGILSDEIGQQASAVHPDAGAALSAANASYGNLAKAGSMAARTAAQRQTLPELIFHGVTGGLAAGGHPTIAGGLQALRAVGKYGALPAAKALQGLAQAPEALAMGITGSAVPELPAVGSPASGWLRALAAKFAQKPQQPMLAQGEP